MKKLWKISGTKDEFSSDKIALKAIRTQLNKDAGVDEKEVNANDWKFHITKGPDHPRL